jgi:tetratricopeptide (TPR) repeat protein
MDSLGIVSTTVGLLGAVYAVYEHIKPAALDGGSATFRLRKLAGSEEAEVDIVFVHGLGTNSDLAWVGRGDNGQDFCWPTDSLPKRLSGICSARILAYDYDTTYWTPEYLTERTLLAQTSHLAQSLASLGHETLGKPRPIIFVAHSLGGIVVKNALVLAATSDESRVRQVYERTAGLIFLATPHAGCPGAIARNICGMVGSLGIDFKDGEYEDLLGRSTSLAYALERFKPLATDLPVHTFGQVRPRQGHDNSWDGIAKHDSSYSTTSTLSAEWAGSEASTSDVFKHKRYSTDCDDASLAQFAGEDDKDLGKVMDSICSMCSEAKTRKPHFNSRSLQWNRIGTGPGEDTARKKFRCDLGNMLPERDALATMEEPSPVMDRLHSYFSHRSVSGECLPAGADGSDSWWPLSAMDGHLRKLDPYISKWLLSRPFFHAVSRSSWQSSWPVVILSGPPGSGKTRTALEYARMREKETRYGSALWVDATDRQTLETSFLAIAQQIRLQFAGNDGESVVQLFGLDGLLDKGNLDDSELQTLVGAVTDWLEGTHGARWLLIIDNLSLDSPYPPRRTFAQRLSWKAKPIEAVSSSAASVTERNDSWYAAASASTEDGTLTRSVTPVSRRRSRHSWKWNHWRQLIRLMPFVTGAKGHIIITTRERPNIPGPMQLDTEQGHMGDQSRAFLKSFCADATSEDDPLASIGVDTPSNTDLAKVYERQQEFSAARRLYKLELENLEQEDDHVDAGNSALMSLQLDLARTYQSEGLYTEAGAQYESILQQKFVEDEPEKRLSAIRQLATVRAEQGQMEEAVKQASQGLGLEDPFGGDVENPQILELIYELSRYLFTAGNRQAASSLLERLVMSLVHVHGFHHPTVLTARDALVKALMSTGDMEPASKQLECVCKCRSRLLGEDHPTTLLSRAKLGLLLNRRGLVDDALITLTRCLMAAERTLGASHPLVFRVRENLCWVLRTQGKDKLAEVELKMLRRELTDHAGLYSPRIQSAYSGKRNERDMATIPAWMNSSRSSWVLDGGDDDMDDELEL